MSTSTPSSTIIAQCEQLYVEFKNGRSHVMETREVDLQDPLSHAAHDPTGDYASFSYYTVVILAVRYQGTIIMFRSDPLKRSGAYYKSGQVFERDGYRHSDPTLFADMLRRDVSHRVHYRRGGRADFDPNKDHLLALGADQVTWQFDPQWHSKPVATV